MQSQKSNSVEKLFSSGANLLKSNANSRSGLLRGIAFSGCPDKAEVSHTAGIQDKGGDFAFIVADKMKSPASD